MEQSVYIFGQMAVKSYDDYFTQYGLPFLPILEKFNGKLLAATKMEEPSKVMRSETGRY